MQKTAIFYGPVGGSTEYVAKKIQEIIGSDRCDLIPVREASVTDLEKYDNIIFGIATIGNETWHNEPVKSGWFGFMPELEKCNFSGKKCAIFGLGDQIRYADHFVDAMADVYEVIMENGATVTGSVDPEGYEFNHSRSLIDGKFIGLPVDEDFESDRTSKRIKSWLEEIMPQLGL